MESAVRTTLRRKTYYVDFQDEHRSIDAHREEADGDVANLFSSELIDLPGMHAPTLDIDRIEVTAIPSSTDGNYHLYIDKPLTWDQYVRLLTLLAEIGICEQGFVEKSIERGASFLRLPDVKKQPGDVGDS